MDRLHTLEGFFPKETIVALAAAQGAEESEILVGAQEFDRHSGAPRKLSNRHRIRASHRFPFPQKAQLAQQLSRLTSLVNEMATSLRASAIVG